MNQDYQYSLESAQEAFKKGDLFEWVQEYLRGEGWNEGLADNLIEGEPTIIQLVEFPLDKLKRIIGPEEGMNYVEAHEVWEKRVGSLVEKIKEEKKLPPMIVTDFWKPLELSDGSHRHEALLRCGYDKYWTIFFFNKEESRSLLE